MDKGVVFGIDIGGSAIKGTLVDVNEGQMIDERLRLLTPQPATPEAMVAVMKELVDRFNYKGLVGAGYPGIVKNNQILTAANVDKSWIGVNLKGLLEDATGCEAFVCNDADAAGIAEMEFGAGKGEQGLVIMITLGTGIGTAVFYRGHLIPNSEFGHLYLKGHDQVVEKYAAESARQRDNISWEAYGQRLNEYLVHLDRLFAPDLYIFGGGGSKNFKEFSPFLQPNARITSAQTLNKAGIIGAGMYAVREKRHQQG